MDYMKKPKRYLTIGFIEVNTMVPLCLRSRDPRPGNVAIKTFIQGIINMKL